VIGNYGYPDIFVAKLDANGNWLWAKNAGESNHDHGSGIAVDNSGNSYVTGYFRYAANFGILTLSGYGEYDIFVAKLDANGNWICADNAGGVNWDYSNGIAVDNSGNLYVTGYFAGTAFFDNTTLVSNGGYDLFIARHSPVFTGIDEELTPETVGQSRLYGNYPNPFNPETKIMYWLGKTQNVKVEIFNLKGQLIKTLVNETQSSGDKFITWKGDNNSGIPAACGVYFVKLMTGNTVSTKKMIMMK
jgi:hypothetical protein